MTTARIFKVSSSGSFDASELINALEGTAPGTAATMQRQAAAWAHPKPCRAKSRPSAVPRTAVSLADLDDGLCTCGTGRQGSRRCPLHWDRQAEVLRSIRAERSYPKNGTLKMAKPSKDYLIEASQPSKECDDTCPLIVLSIEGVLCAKLPPHLSGGHSDYLRRMYLHTFINYLLKHNKWNIAFYTGSMTRDQALLCLKQLGLPTGGPEEDERDGCMGVWSREDLVPGLDADNTEIGIKDLEALWAELKSEEGIPWGVHNTVLVTCNETDAALQPFNALYVPPYNYRSSTASFNDQVLLILIAMCAELSTESNYPAYIEDMKFDEKFFTDVGSKADIKRALSIQTATRVCCQMRIPIIGGTGN